jgi:D-alanyl-lipoteichoic acid acyltransferase DltB (MBOAT superfamily)
MVTFLVSGFWHGAGWTFVVWGLCNGLLVCAAAWMKRHGKRFPFPLAFFLTAIGIVALRVLFVSASFADALHVYQGMVNLASLKEGGLNFLAYSGKAALVSLAIGLALCLFAPNSGALIQRFKISWISLLASALLIALALLRMNNGAEFLYFQF